MRILFSIVGAAALCVGAPVMANDGDGESDKGSSTSEDIDELKKIVDDLKTNQGQDTVSTGAGKAEANLLAAAIVRDAAKWVSRQIKDHTDSKNIVITDSTGDIGLYPYFAVSTSIESFIVQADALESLTDSESEIAPQIFNQDAGRGEAGSLDLISSVIGLVASIAGGNSTLKDFAITGVTDSALIREVSSSEQLCGSSGRGICFSPDLVIVTDLGTNSLFQQIDSLNKKLSTLALTRAGSKQPFQDLVTKYSLYMAKISTATNEEPALLAEALRGAQIAQIYGSFKDESVFLRLAVEHSAGSLLERKNLWTALGASRLAVTGTAHVSYSLSSANGKVFASGMRACGTDLTALSKIRREVESIRTKCGPSEGDEN